TIIFVPHARARFRQLTISNRLLAVAAGSAAFLLVAAVAFGWAYLASSHHDREYRMAIAENDRLRATTAALHQRLDGVSKQLSDSEARTRRLAIVAGLTDSVRGGLGGPAASTPSADLVGQSALVSSRLSQLESQFSRRFELVASTPTVWPVHGAVN